MKILFLVSFAFLYTHSATSQRKYSFGFYVDQSGFNITQDEEAVGVVLRYLESFPHKIKITNPRENLRLKNKIVDEYGMTHLSLTQMYKGVVVHTGTIKVHFDRKGGLESINGELYYDVDLDVAISIDSARAERTALIDAQKSGDANVINNENVSTTLIIYPLRFINPADSGKYEIVWKVYVAGVTTGESWEYLISAKNGKIVYRFSDPRGSWGNNVSEDTVPISHPDTLTSLPTKKSEVLTSPKKNEESKSKFDPSDPSTYPPNLKIIPIPLDSLEKLKGKNQPEGEK